MVGVNRFEPGTVLLALIFGAVFAVHCGATAHEPCTQADLDRIVAAHEARLVEKCVDQGPDCSARKEENARFKDELRVWVRCSR